MIPTDIRAGLPSASILGRLSACPASWHLGWIASKQGIGANNSSAAADSGHRIHKWLETKDEIDWGLLTDDEQDVARKCDHQAMQVIADWGDEDNGYTRERERRLWLYANGDVWTGVAAPNESKPIFSGAADLIVIGSNSRALVLDWKSGRGDYEPAPGNPQLAALAVLTSLWTDARHIRVALIQPLAGPPSVADYDGPALDEAKDQLLALLAHIEQPGLKPVTGNHCCYCPARAGVCPAITRELLMLPSPLDTPEAIEEFIREEYDGPKLARILSVSKRAEWMIKAARDEAKRRLECADPGSPPGWTLREGAKTREVTDAIKLYEILKEPPTSVTPEEMSSACRVSLPDLEASVAERTGMTKTRALAKIADIGSEFIVYGRKAPSLVEDKPRRIETTTTTTE